MSSNPASPDEALSLPFKVLTPLVQARTPQPRHDTSPVTVPAARIKTTPGSRILFTGAAGRLPIATDTACRSRYLGIRSAHGGGTRPLVCSPDYRRASAGLPARQSETAATLNAKVVQSRPTLPTCRLRLKAYDVAGFVAGLRRYNVTPHVAQNTTNRRSAIDRRTTRHPGYAVSGRIRKRIEEVFGWRQECRRLSQDPSPRPRPCRLDVHADGHCLQLGSAAQAGGAAA
jgi:hypothetical protein